MLWDTNLEYSNEIGRSYEFQPMKYGECTLTQKHAELLEVEVGDMIYYQLNIRTLYAALVNKYNDYATKNGKD